MTFFNKKILAPLLLLSFTAVAFLSFATMSYGQDGHMQGDCPFSTTGTPLCPQDAFSMVLHHISAYQSFLNVPVDFGITALLMALSLIGIALMVSKRLFLQIPIILTRLWYEPPFITSQERKLTRWLSILENSPSFS